MSDGIEVRDLGSGVVYVVVQRPGKDDVLIMNTKENLDLLLGEEE